MEVAPTGVLSDRDILKEYRLKNLIITDFKDENLGNNSYDVCLGAQYYMNVSTPGNIYNPYSHTSANSWTLRNAMTIDEWTKTISLKLGGFPAREFFDQMHMGSIEDDDLVIILPPRETILAHTQEFIGGLPSSDGTYGITSMMKARSGLMRNMVSVCLCAGLGDIGYCNRWTMEISNHSDFFIPLVVGRRIAQIVFFYTGPCQTSYEKKESAKYQKSSNLKELQDSWEPSMMLPRLYRDKVPSKF